MQGLNQLDLPIEIGCLAFILLVFWEFLVLVSKDFKSLLTLTLLLSGGFSSR